MIDQRGPLPSQSFNRQVQHSVLWLTSQQEADGLNDEDIVSLSQDGQVRGVTVEDLTEHVADHTVEEALPEYVTHAGQVVAEVAGADVIPVVQGGEMKGVSVEGLLGSGLDASFGSVNMETMESTKKYDFCDVCQQKSRYEPYVMMMNKGDGYYYISSPISDTEAWECKIVPDADGMKLIDACSMKVASTPVEEWVSVYPPYISGTWITSASPNIYTTTIGDTIRADVTGTDIWVKTYKDNRGGIWSFVVDGAAPVVISTYNSTAQTNQYQQIATGLSAGSHTVVGTFAGDDPSNVPSGGAGTSRGWVYRDPYTNVTFYDASGGSALALGLAEMGITNAAFTDTLLLHGASKKEFALSVRPDAEAGWTPAWVPYHSGTTGVCRNVTSTMYADGKAAPAIASLAQNYFFEMRSVVIVTTYEAYHPSDTESTYKLWDGTLILRFLPGGISGYHKIVFTSDTYVATGYPSMTPAVPALINFITGHGKTRTLTGSAELLYFEPSNEIAFDNGTYRVAHRQNNSLFDLLRSAARLDTGTMIVNYEPPTYSKAYWRSFYTETVLTGTVWDYSWDWAFCRK